MGVCPKSVNTIRHYSPHYTFRQLHIHMGRKKSVKRNISLLKHVLTKHMSKSLPIEDTTTRRLRVHYENALKTEKEKWITEKEYLEKRLEAEKKTAEEERRTAEEARKTAEEERKKVVNLQEQLILLQSKDSFQKRRFSTSDQPRRKIPALSTEVPIHSPVTFHGENEFVPPEDGAPPIQPESSSGEDGEPDSSSPFSSPSENSDEGLEECTCGHVRTNYCRQRHYTQKRIAPRRLKQ